MRRIGQNSWGTGWGQQGYFLIAYNGTALMNIDGLGFNYSATNNIAANASFTTGQRQAGDKGRRHARCRVLGRHARAWQRRTLCVRPHARSGDALRGHVLLGRQPGRHLRRHPVGRHPVSDVSASRRSFLLSGGCCSPRSQQTKRFSTHRVSTPATVWSYPNLTLSGSDYSSQSWANTIRSYNLSCGCKNTGSCFELAQGIVW